MTFNIVLDTNIMVAALQNEGSVAREILRLCLQGQIQPLIGAALFAEYEDVLNRELLFQGSKLNQQERDMVLNGFLSVCKWSEVFYAWRPNLPDEADNHLIELAIAGQADFIVTRNLKDLTRGELIFNQLQIVGPEYFLKMIRPPKEST
ncbi:putative toxin-antitoxin system toxin component, PIN family [Methylophilus sp. 13]|uniref:putative toxin-antitoxin system toxin component, PIN family n=1 Tax=Methylophilus sp. 13 TaxID=2781018 RepID=UPI00188F6D7A|nr:putative toxin-antitoxin system toxin component, PIN family [Methylophilus sp. 13]MBF5038429.1 putative toxin-antitoxin system toxin component, PIN family [Methylophilus sp. 13]